jgi:hypothetical protein
MEDSLLAEPMLVFIVLLVRPSVIVVSGPFGRFTATVKADVQKSPPPRGLLRRRFFRPSPAVKVHHPSPEVSVALSLALVVREVGVEGVYFPLGVCFSVTPIVDEGDDFRLNGLIQSQKWPVGFGLSLEMVG